MRFVLAAVLVMALAVGPTLVTAATSCGAGAFQQSCSSPAGGKCDSTIAAGCNQNTLICAPFDNTAPYFTFTNFPVNGYATNNAPLNFQISATECGFTTATWGPSPVNTPYALAGCNGYNGGCSPTIATGSLSPLPEGTYYLVLQGKDIWNNLHNTVTQFFLDRTAPTINGAGPYTVNPLATQATIFGGSNEITTSRIDYGTTPSYGSTYNGPAAATTTHVDVLTGLQPQTRYYYKVTYTDPAGNSVSQTAGLDGNPQSFVTGKFPDTTAPTAPSGLGGNVYPTSSALTWTASVDPVVNANTITTGIARYDVYRNNVKIGVATTNAYYDAGLLPQTSYSYHVIPVDGAGNAGPKSNTFSANTPKGIYSYGITDVQITNGIASGGGHELQYVITTQMPSNCDIQSLYYSTQRGPQVPANAFTKYSVAGGNPAASENLPVSANPNSKLGIYTHTFKLRLGEGTYAIVPVCTPSCGDNKCTGAETGGLPTAGGSVCTIDCGCGSAGKTYGYLNINTLACGTSCQTTPYNTFYSKGCVNNTQMTAGSSRSNIYTTDITQTCPIAGSGIGACVVCSPGLYIDPLNPNAGCSRFVVGDTFCRADVGEPAYIGPGQVNTDCLNKCFDYGLGTYANGGAPTAWGAGECAQGATKNYLLWKASTSTCLSGQIASCTYEGCWSAYDDVQCAVP